MTYLIALIVILVLIVLFLLLYSPKYKSEQEIAQHEKAVDELTTEAPQVPVEPESIPETETEAESVETAAGTVETVEEAELSLDEPVDVAAVEEHELGLEYDEVIEDGGPELDFAPPEEEPDRAAGEEHELELSLDEVPEETDTVITAPEPELSLEEPPEAVEIEEPELIVPEEFEEEIPFIVEEGETPPKKADEEVAPALSGFTEDEETLTREETPEDLAARLDFFFGSDDEAESAVAETFAEPDEPETVVVDAEDVVAVEAVSEEIVPEVAGSLTLEIYEAGLRVREEKLRHDLNAAIESGETAKLALLELGLVDVCEMLTDVQTSLVVKQGLIADIEETLKDLEEALPGFAGKGILQNLYEGDSAAAGTLLAEAASQPDTAPDLAARTRYLAGRLAEEQAEFAAAFELYKEAGGSEDDSAYCPEYPYAIGRMARILGLDEEAQHWLVKVVNAADGGGDGNIVPAQAQHELARVYVRTGQKDKAESLMKQAMAVMEKQGADDPGLGSVAHDLAALYESSGMYEQAEPLYKQALEVTEKGLGSDHPRLGVTLNKLAGLYEEMELEDQAEPLYTRALDIKKKVLGERHPDVGTILNNLANLLKLQGKYDLAEPMFLQSLDIAEKALGKDHPNLAVVLNNIAELYSETGREEEAERFQERAFALFELPGGGGDFVEMEKDHEIDIDDEKNKTIVGS